MRASIVALFALGAAVMMAARVLSQYRFERTIRFITFAGEEQWMAGSDAYVRDANEAGENIIGAINLDMFLHPGWDNRSEDLAELVACPADLDADGQVGFGDVLLVLGVWGPCEDCPADLDGNGFVEFDDILIVLSSWGSCP